MSPSQNSDQSPFFDLVLAVRQLQKLVGSIRCVHAIGRCSKMVLKMLGRQEKEEKAAGLSRPPSASDEMLIDNMLIVDRDLDYLSTLLSQLNYEGLLDETFGIETCNLQFRDSRDSKVDCMQRWPTLSTTPLFLTS